MNQFVFLRGVSIVVLILANGFFVAAELALVSVRETRVEQLIGQRRPGARLVRKLQQHLDDFLPAVQLGVTLCSLALGWIGEPVVADIFEAWLDGLADGRAAERIAQRITRLRNGLLGDVARERGFDRDQTGNGTRQEVTQ